MSDITAGKKRYKDIFSRLVFRNKEKLNEISDNLDSKKLNRFSKTQILSNVADMVLDSQERGKPLDELFEKDLNAYCDKLSENAPRANRTERLLLALRNISAGPLIISVITMAAAVLGDGSASLDGIRALQLAGGAALYILCFPMVSYRDALRNPRNMIFPTHSENVAKSRVLPKMILYSALCLAGLIVYGLFFWVYPETLMKLGLDGIEMNMPVLTVVAAAAFLVFLFLERSVSVRNFQRREIAAEDFQF